MKKILLSLLTIAFVGGTVYGATSAFFSDTETSEGNTFTAGEIDLTVASTAHYSGMICVDGLWEDEDENSENNPLPDLIGTPCVGTWTSTDLGETNTFFNLTDIKPGDWGENTLTLNVTSNPSYVCAIVDNMVDGENGITEPEGEDGDTTADEGELSQYLRFFAWADDGDNVWEENETPLFANLEGPASDVMDGVVWPLFSPETEALEADTPASVGLYWCYGEMAIDSETNTLSCDGSVVDNQSQTDSLMTDISFYAEQSRNNDDFQCPALPVEEEEL